MLQTMKKGARVSILCVVLFFFFFWIRNCYFLCSMQPVLLLYRFVNYIFWLIQAAHFNKITCTCTDPQQAIMNVMIFWNRASWPTYIAINKWICYYNIIYGSWGTSEALCYKLLGRGLDSWWGHWIFLNWPNLPTALWPWDRLSL
jgi:hypothetical protein